MRVQDVWVVFDTKRFEIIGVYYLMGTAHRIREKLTEKLVYESEASSFGTRYGVMRLESAIEVLCRNAVITNQRDLAEEKEEQTTEEGHIIDAYTVD